jgi:peptidoglycan/xylan/chitin deacetylase (PgdA/CDA1 family)
LNIRSHLAGVRRQVLSSLYRRTVPLGDCGPIVSFCFDDFPRTAYTVGGAILEKFGARGTYYAAVALMDGSTEVGEQFRPADLHPLLEKGHELASHTFSHVSCRAVSASAFREDARKGRAALEKMTGSPSANFAYPFGHVTLAAKKALEPELTSCRSIFPGFNGPEIDLNLLRSCRLYGDVDQVRSVEDVIQENAKRKTWLIFSTHDVRPTPSRYGCTPALLEYAVSAAARSGARILTVQQTLLELGIGSSCAESGIPGQAQVS